MSKLITSRYEYAYYDDTQGVLTPPADTPPTYPPTLDSYRVSSTAAIAQSYGAQTLSSSGAATPCFTPSNATVTIFSPTTNTNLLGVTITNATPTLNAAPVNLTFFCGAGQTITIPNSINSGILSIAAYTLALVTTSASFSANVAWNL